MNFRTVALSLAISFPAWTSAAHAQTPTLQPRQLTVTLARKTPPAQPLVPDDVQVQQGHALDRVTGLAPAQGAAAALQLWVLIDDESVPALNSSLPALQSFLAAQGPATQVGVAYMQYGTVRIAHALTRDHAAAARALREPMSIPGMSSSPWDSVQELLQQWPTPYAPRREVVMLSSGIDLVGVPVQQDPFFADALRAVQQNGVVFYDIYVPAAGNIGRSPLRNMFGQEQLAQLGEESGGAAFFVTNGGQLISGPLDDIRASLDRQYLLSFHPAAGSRTGLNPIVVRSTLKDVDLAAPDAAYVTQ